ncbi:TRAP transporter substrate-binding protein [Desulfobotulus sp. H1]|uniref:TRAP transporter substrate-binding protein n=1 Tax=Desulfobotulus pelophilus TaxID=2823377 RepID=A0ABT3N8G8_9BACT|nr:TRAP transporter substrate-binding protein [Desulfobotulus pelophilus]MCW7753742.1 TRAP transporter substrate-binding protein [Desulfobotulus pelophilus]
MPCFLRGTIYLFPLLLLCTAAMANNALEAFTADFDSSEAPYRCIVSNVSHPVIQGVSAGFVLRDRIWEKSNGQIYVDFKPLSMLGGEVEVLNLLQMGAIQGMGVSSVAATNLGPRFGVVNLPFLVDSFDKLERFVNSGPLFDHFLRAMEHQGIIGLDITAYGNYGWASTQPIQSLAEARTMRLRIAEAAVNQLIYREWGLRPVVMPWPDVPVALRQGVINSLDHTPTVCNITRKFEVARHFTEVNYAQGLFIWIFNKAWLDSLPDDLKVLFQETVREVASEIRQQAKDQEEDEIRKAKEAGVTFHRLSDADMSELRARSVRVHDRYRNQINRLYRHDEYRPENYLLEMQNLLDYVP